VVPAAVKVGNERYAGVCEVVTSLYLHLLTGLKLLSFDRPKEIGKVLASD